MPEILKNSDGSTNWAAIFAAFGAMAVLILQQWQTYRISEIKTQADVNKVNFLNKDEVYKIERDLAKRVKEMEDRFIDRDIILKKFTEYDERILALEKKHDK